MMKVLNPPKGFRDFTPEEMIVRKKVIALIEETYISYGFDPIETPVLEYWDLLKGKYGEEAETKLIYYFKDPWSEKWYALRYDLTVPLARFLAKRSFPLPFKRYHIGRVWRHDRPQRARYREFWQADADIVGSIYPESDAEVINVTISALRKIGFNDFKILINDRKLMETLLGQIIKNGDFFSIYRAVDKLDKIGKEGVVEELKRLGLSQEIIEKIFGIIRFKGDLDSLKDFLEETPYYNEEVKEIIDRLEEIDELLIDKNKIEYSLSLVRGLDYYTGPVWEVKISNVEFPSVGGGGRYDNLLKIIIGKDLPATGTSLGIDRLVDAGRELGLFNFDEKTLTKVAVLCMDRRFYKDCWQITNELRSNNISAVIDLMRRKFDKQREYANKKGVRILVILGEKEFKEGKATIVDRELNERMEVPLSQLITMIKDILSS